MDGGQDPNVMLRELTAVLPAAFEAFVELYYVPHLAYADAQLGSQELAEDVVDETFAIIALNWAQVLSGEEQPEAVAWALLRENVTARLEQLGRDTSLVAVCAFTAVLRSSREQFAALEGSVGLYRAIAELPDRQFDVIVMRYVLGYKCAAVAKMLGIETASVRSVTRQARRHLAAKLGIPITAMKIDSE